MSETEEIMERHAVREWIAYTVECDGCHKAGPPHLVSAPNPSYQHVNEHYRMEATRAARDLARSEGWVRNEVAPDRLVCPNCDRDMLRVCVAVLRREIQVQVKTVRDAVEKYRADVLGEDAEDEDLEEPEGRPKHGLDCSLCRHPMRDHGDNGCEVMSPDRCECIQRGSAHGVVRFPCNFVKVRR